MEERRWSAAEIREAVARMLPHALLAYLQGDADGLAPDGLPAVGAGDRPPPAPEIKLACTTVAGAELYNVLGPDGQPINDRYLSRAEAEALARAPAAAPDTI